MSTEVTPNFKIDFQSIFSDYTAKFEIESMNTEIFKEIRLTIHDGETGKSSLIRLTPSTAIYFSKALELAALNLQN